MSRPRDRAEARQRDLRGGRGRACGSAHGAPRSSRQGAAFSRAEGRDPRRVRWCGHVRGVDRQGARRGGHRRVRHAERGLARSLGADHVIDYTREDFTRSDRRYDLMADILGGGSWSDYKRVLDPRATLVVIGGPKSTPARAPWWRDQAEAGRAAPQAESRLLRRDVQQGTTWSPSASCSRRES